MKIKRIVFLVFFLVLNVSNIVAGPPSPPTGPPAPLDMPINEDLPYLIVAGLILGTAIIYRNKIKKASV